MATGDVRVEPPAQVRARPTARRARVLARQAKFAAWSVRERYWDFVGNAVVASVATAALTAVEPFRKDRVKCNFCGWTGSRFYPNTGPGYDEPRTMCPACHAQDRHRSLLVVLLNRTAAFSGSRARVVEVAPMRCLEEMLAADPGCDYTSFDLERHAMERGDITAMTYPDASVDLFIAFHVLEHVPDEAAALREILRVLRPGGTAALQVPVRWDRDRSVEYDGPDPRDVGHVRQYGADFGDHLRAAGFVVEAVSAAELVGEEVASCYGLHPDPIFLARRPD